VYGVQLSDFVIVDKAPILRGIFFGVALSSLVVHLLERGHLFHLVLQPQIIPEGQIWRLITHHFYFQTSAEAFFGAILLYQLRLIERRFGTGKFAVRPCPCDRLRSNIARVG